MVGLTLATFVTLATATVGAGLQYKAGQDQASAQRKRGKAQDLANEQLVANSKRQNKLRLDNLRRENDRKRRQNIRQAIATRSATINRATNAGAGSSSGLAGSLAGITSQAAANQQNINEGERTAFALADEQNAAASIKGTLNKSETSFQTASATNTALNTFGGQLFSSAGSFGNNAASLFAPHPNAGISFTTTSTV